MPKMEAHEKAVLHRAFSVFIFNDKNELMLQQRALINTIHRVCGPIHVVVTNENGESNIEAGKRRLHEEMGFVC